MHHDTDSASELHGDLIEKLQDLISKDSNQPFTCCLHSLAAAGRPSLVLQILIHTSRAGDDQKVCMVHHKGFKTPVHAM